jgi:hypothetical protein
MSEQRANDLLDLVEQARAENDKETEAKAIKAYQMEFGGAPKSSGAIDTLGNKAMRYGKEAVRQIGMTGKNLAEGVVGTAGLITDTPAMIGEALTGRQAPQWMKPAQSFVQGMEQLSGKELAPESSQYVSAPVQRVIGDVQRAVGGGIGGLGAGQAMTRSASPMIRSAGEMLSSPKGAFAPAVTSSLASGITRESGGGPAAQLAAALAGGLAPAGAAGVLKSVSGIKPSPSAQLLINKGVDLTPGQLNKGGLIDQLETSFENFPIIGQIIKAPKDKVEEDLRHALIQESAAPGAIVPKTGKASEMLDAAYDSFDPAYQTVHGFPLVLQKGKPVIVNVGQNVPMDKALQSVVNSRAVMATADTRSSVSGWIQNQLSKPIKNSEDLLNIRSAIRSQIRNIKATDVDSSAKRELLNNAEDVITKTLESQLPPNLMKRLQSVDAAYANYKKLEDAVFKGGESFTPAQVERSIKQGADKGTYARGGGSPLRPLVEAGKEVTAQTLPQTGARLGPMLATAGLIGKGAAAIPAALLSAGLVGTKTGRTLARGGYNWQNAAANRPLDARMVQGLLEQEKARRMANLLAGQE